MIETPKVNISQRIRNYKAANPNATMKEIAAAVGTHLPYVYQVLGQPVKKAKKEKPVTTPADTVSAKYHEEMVRRLAEQTADMMDLEEEIVGLRAVIKYLEERLDY